LHKGGCDRRTVPLKEEMPGMTGDRISYEIGYTEGRLTKRNQRLKGFRIE